MENNHVDESLIEATIRRVAEAAQAARTASPEPADDAEAPEGEPTTATPTKGAPVAAWTPPAEVAASAEEDAIEATIRRVESARAEREQEAAEVEVEVEPLVASEPPRAGNAPLLTFARRGNAVPAVAPSWESDPVLERLQQIERIVGETNELVRQLVTRGTYALPDAAVSSEPRSTRAPAAEDDWEDESPSLSTATFGLPPRPVIVEDAPPAVGSAPDLAPVQASVPDQRRGLDLLPRTYRITVEDKRRGVDLVPLHRALLAMDGVKDMSLLSYNNGVALVALEMVNDIDPDALARAVTRAMSRPAMVETHNERTLVVKLAEE